MERKASEIVSQSQPSSGWAAAGTYIARPLRRNESGTMEEQKPLIAPGSLSGLSILAPPRYDNVFHGDDEMDEDMDEESTLLPSTGLRNRNVDTPSDLRDVDLSDENENQNQSKSKSNT